MSKLRIVRIYIGGLVLEHIYIIVAQTQTAPAKFFKFFTKKPYNHVSLSGSADLSDMYSFCRTYTFTPLPATFNREIVGKGTLGLFDNIPCEIYKIAVTERQKEEYYSIIRHFINNRDVYSYNIIGILPLYFNIEYNRKNSFTCSQFVAYTLDKIGIELEKHFSLYIPDDFRNFPGAELFYIGELNSFYSRFHSIGKKTVANAAHH